MTPTYSPLTNGRYNPTVIRDFSSKVWLFQILLPGIARRHLLLTILCFFSFNNLFSQTATFTSSGSWTCPAGVTTILVECWGGGGAGGNATGNPSAGGGGAGGAYARKTLSVTPGTIYTVTVGAASTSANNGNPSWFNSTSTVFAQGGAAGASASTNGGSGGSGSSGSCIGDVVFAGGSGADGLTSSTAGAGGGGAGSSGNGASASGGTGGGSTSTNGGAGANGVGNSTNGSNGSNYGGGGSGGRANTGSNKTGGQGAQGYVLINYTSYCPVSNSISPSAVQNLCQGSSAATLNNAVTFSGINGTPTVLYQWYYNTVNNNTITGATLVSGATSSTYTPLTTASEVGTRYYFCVAYATNNGCGQTNVTQSLASNTVQVTVSATSVGGTIASSQSVCISSQISSNLTLSGNTAGATVQWQKSTDNFGVIINNIGAGGTSLTPAQLGAVSATTYVRAIVTSGVCPSANSTSVTITPYNPATLTSTTSPTAICSGNSFSYTATSSLDPTISFTWTRAAIANINGNVAGGGSGSSISETLTNSSLSTVSVVYVFNMNNNGCISTQNVTLPVNPIPAVTTASTKTICSGTDANIVLTASTGSSFTWTVGTITGGIAGASAGSGNTISQVLTNPGNATAGTVEYIVTPTSTVNSCAGNPYTITVTVNPLPAVTTASTASTCSGTGPSLNLTASVASTYTWTVGTITGGITGASASSGTPINQTLTNPSNAVAGSVVYNVIPTSTAGSCVGASYPITITVNPKPAVTSSTSASICSATGPNINLTASTASSFAWTIGPITGGITGASASSGNTINQALTNPSNSASGTVQYQVTPTATTGSCVGNATTITVTVTPTPAVTTASTKTICSGTDANIALTASTGSSFTWTVGTITGSITGASAGSGNTISQVLTNPGNATAGTVEYIVTPTSTVNSCAGNPYTITVTVNPLPVITTLQTTQNICNNGTPVINFNSSVSGSTFAWTRDNPAGSAGVGALSAFSGSGNISSGTLSNSISSPVMVSFTATPTANGCTGATVNNIATVTVLPVATVNATSNQTFCHNAATTAINFTGTGTSYTWTNSNTSIGLGANGTGNIASFTGNNSGTSPISGSINVTPVYTVGGTNCNGTPSGFSITVNPIPVLSSTLTANVCSGSTFNYNPTSSASGVTLSYNWTRAVVANISNGAASGSGNPGETLNNTSNLAQNVTYVYTVAGTNNSVTCTNPANYNLVTTVNATPTISASPSAAQSICTGIANNFSAITLSNPNSVGGTTLSWNRTNGALSSGNIQGIAANGTGNIPASTLTNSTGSIQTSVFTAIASYNGCSSNTTVNVQVNPPITNLIGSSTVFDIDICNITKQVNIDAPPATGGNGSYTYQWQFSTPGYSAFSDLPGETGEDLIYSYSIANAFFQRIAYSDACASVISDFIQVNGPVINSVTLATANNISYCTGGTGGSISLNGTIAGATYTLQRNTGGNTWVDQNPPAPIVGTGTGITFTGITTPGTYRVSSTITTPTACTQVLAGTVTVSIDPLPSAPTVSGTATICQGSATNISATTTPASLNVNWYSTASGGSPLNGTPLNSGTNYSVSPSSTSTYYAETINTTTGCVSNARNSVTITVNPRATMTSAASGTICSQGAINIPLTNNINAAATYTWIAQDNTSTTGESLTNQTTSTLNNTITNNTNTSQIVTYTVTPTYPVGCVGNSQTVLVTVDPKPVVVAQSATICGGNSFTITPSNGGGNSIPASPATLYTWSAPSGSGFTGGATGTNSTNISGTLLNSTNGISTATYTVTPVTGSCSGNSFTATVTINPRPYIVDTTISSCSPISFSITPGNGYGGTYIVPANTTYTWAPPTGSNISGIASGTNQASISGLLTNTSSPGIPSTAVYTVTPTGPVGLGSCVGSTFKINANIYPVPTGSIAGSTSVCQGAGSPNISFTGANGATPYSFTYNINGGAPSIISTSGVATTVTLPVSTATAGSFTYTITNVADASAIGCNSNVSLPATVVVNANATATLSGGATICASGSTSLSISIPSGVGLYNGTLSPGGIAFSGTAPTLNVIVSPASSTNYSIATISGSCINTAGSALVTVPSGTPGEWKCTVSNDWFDCRNWANGSVPTNTTDVVINSALAGCNPVINPSSPFAPVDQIARARNVSIMGSANLSFSGAGNLYVAGNWINSVGSAGFTAGTSTVTFMGSSGVGCVQTITTTGGNTETFNNLSINNSCSASAGDNVTLNSPVNVSSSLTLTAGVVKTSNSNMLTITNPSVAAISGGSAASYVNGPLSRFTNSTSSYSYPLGSPNGSTLYGAYRPAEVIPSTASLNSYTGQYFPSTAPENSNPLLGPTGIISTEYWDIRPTGACSGTVVVGLYYVNPFNSSHWTGGIAPCATCNVAIAKPAQPSNAWYFTDYPNYVGSGFNGLIPEDRAYNSSGWIYTKPIDCTGFQSPHFTFGFNFSTVLPVQLINFEGKLINNSARLNWSTTDSHDLAGFVLEHSSDGNKFNTISSVNPNANNNYEFIDRSLSNGSHYYRLLIANKNGQKAYSKTILLVLNEQTTIIRELYPNPVDEIGKMNIWSAARQNAGVSIYDVTGRLVSQYRFGLIQGENQLNIPATYLAAGIYNLVIVTDDRVHKNLRLVKK